MARAASTGCIPPLKCGGDLRRPHTARSLNRHRYGMQKELLSLALQSPAAIALDAADYLLSEGEGLRGIHDQGLPHLLCPTARWAQPLSAEELRFCFCSWRIAAALRCLA